MSNLAKLRANALGHLTSRKFRYPVCLEPEKRAAAETKPGAAASGKGWFELRQGENLKFKLPGEAPSDATEPERG